MKFRMPYVYRANVRPPKNRNFVSQYFGGHVVVDIPEASDEEAPVAARWSSADEVQTYEGRVMGDRFFVAVQAEDGRPLRADEIDSDHIHKFTFAGSTGPYGDQAPIDLYKRGELTKSVEDFKECTQNEEEQVLDEIRQELSDILVVDGILYRTQPVPVIVASRRRSSEHDTILFELSYVDEARHWSEMHFPLTRADEAISWAENLKRAAADMSLPGVEVHKGQQVHVEVFRPDLLPDPDFLVLDLKRTVAGLLKHLGKELESHADTYIDRWQELRRVSHGLHQGCGSDVVDATMSAWRDLLESVEDVEIAKARAWETTYSRQRQSEFATYAYYLPRWENMDIGLQIGADHVGPTAR